MATVHITAAESAAAFGFGDGTDSWKSIAIGQATSNQRIRLEHVSYLRTQTGMSRAQQIGLVWETAALHMPQIAKAFLLEIDTFFLPSPRRKPLDEHRPYSLLLKQIYCTSYFARWCKEGGEDVELFMKTLLAYVSKLALADTVNPTQLEQLGIHIEVLVNAILYSPHPLPFALLPSSATDPSLVAAKSFLLALVGHIRGLKFDHRYAMIGGPAKQLRDWIVGGGRRRMEQSFKIEMWSDCSGGCITNCSERNVEKLSACGRCKSVLYCSPEHQKQHWNGRQLEQLTFPHKTICFKSPW